MTYAEAYEIAYSIGYHKGRMAAAENWDAVMVDQDCIAHMLQKLPTHFRTMAIGRYEQGSILGENS